MLNKYKRSPIYEVMNRDYCYIAVAIGGAAIVGAGAQMYGASQAAGAQQSAAAQNAAVQAAQYQQTREDLGPFRQAGANAINELTGRMPEFTKGVSMTQADLEQTPGYQFNLAQGLKSVQNSAAARGLGASGAAQKGAARFATGLADSTYQNQFNNAVTNQTNSYNRLMGLVNVGQSSAAQTAAVGTQTASNIGNALTGAGNAQAAAWNSMGSAVGNAASGIAGAYAYNGLYGAGGNTPNPAGSAGQTWGF